MAAGLLLGVDYYNTPTEILKNWAAFYYTEHYYGMLNSPPDLVVVYSKAGKKVDN